MKLKGFLISLAMAGAVSLLVANDASAKYEEMDVQNGGSITGKVTLKGTPPAPKLHELSKFPQASFCGQVDTDGKGNRVQHLISVGKDGSLSDVVVFIEKIEKGKPFKFGGTDVTSDVCRFLVQGPSSFVGVVRTNGEFRVKNLDADPSDPKSADGVLHNPHTYNIYGASSRTIFNKPLATKGQTLEYKIKKIDLKRSPIMFLQCDQHNFMEAWFYEVEHPYYAVVGKDGTFTIDNIPPGEYELVAWHPMIDDSAIERVEQKIKISAGGKVTVNFEFKEADVKIKGGEQKED